MNLIEFLRTAKIEDLGLLTTEVLPQEIDDKLEQIRGVLNSLD